MCLFLVFYSVVNFPAHVNMFLIVVGGIFVFAGGFYVTAIPCVCRYFGLLLLWLWNKSRLFGLWMYVIGWCLTLFVVWVVNYLQQVKFLHLCIFQTEFTYYLCLGYYFLVVSLMHFNVKQPQIIVVWLCATNKIPNNNEEPEKASSDMNKRNAILILPFCHKGAGS